ANVTRSANSSGKWADNELVAYNITVTAIPPALILYLPPPAWMCVDANVSDSTYSFLQYPNDATTPDHGMAVRVHRIDEFAREVLITVGFEKGRYGVFSPRSIPLMITVKSRR
ncbi:uncharacterized protein BJ212DRAFT_1507826, partial [Suillus subaureus]